MILYFFIIEKNHQHCDMDGLLDIHSRATLRRVAVAMGDPLKVATCPWCGYTTQNIGSTCAHTRKNHEGMLIVYGGCFAYASFCPDSVSTHWANCPPFGGRVGRTPNIKPTIEPAGINTSLPFQQLGLLGVLTFRLEEELRKLRSPCD